MGVRNGALGLTGHLARQRGGVDGLDVGGQPSAGVDDTERAAVPLGDEVLAIARHSGLLFHNRAPATDKSVHERRLTHVGASDDRNDREHVADAHRRRHRNAATSDAPSVGTTSTGRGRSSSPLPSRNRPFDSTTSGSK